METVLITGGTGLIGKAITNALLDKGYSVIVLSRNPGRQFSKHHHLSYAAWDIENKTIDNNAIEKTDYILHLAGASLAEKRWTEKRKQEIIESRVKSSALLLDAVNKYGSNVKAVISSSATGYYGENPPSTLEKGKWFSETDLPANDFLGNVCKQWEESMEPVVAIGKRLVKLRLGIVLSNDGGALKEFKKPLKVGLATILGSGKQIISWIHIDDMVNLFLFAMENTNMSGVYNAVAPNPVSNKELILQLAKSKRKYFILVYVPSFILKILLGEVSKEILKSATVSADKIEDAGFSFQHSTIESAIQNLSGK